MNWNIPGTTLSVPRESANSVEQQFTAMFLGGGIVLSQVSAVSGLEPYAIQNWVKRGFLPAPVHKRYDMNQLCRILTINMLKPALPMEKITGLIGYVNGELDDAADDLIDDATLYFRFLRLAARVDDGFDRDRWSELVREEIADYREPVSGAKERVEKVLLVMLLAWSAAKLQKMAENALEEMSI